MEHIEQQTIQYSPRQARNAGAHWFYWLALASAVNSLIVFYFNTPNSMAAFGITRWIDGTSGALTADGVVPPLTLSALIVNLLIAAGFALFGYFARRGSDLAFVIGIFLYVLDSMLMIGLRDLFGFGFHLVGLYFLTRGLLASRHLRENATTI
ncbi:hypothetical protein [Leptolyngbya sp. 7M]|uniref:hypothetical protein n=1 Tax=Leptolyngbya sp. 7M TaxID=2812896 RepID=UPI001B8BA85D|nr:hypothetical protein [Leptolyngbya sp. 7M]QYO67328.1 hypothetical protein JVX88_11295 [Leptolyngbya sp. 7M]